MSRPSKGTKSLNRSGQKLKDSIFNQKGPCNKVAPKLPKCRDCQSTSSQDANEICRFIGFRKLRYTKTGQLAIAGFDTDPLEEDLKLWVPNPLNPPQNLDFTQAKFLLAQIGDQFCDLIVQEKMAKEESLQKIDSMKEQIAWKRVVNGVREVCDVCETSLFNYHWTCRVCGFAVCIDCYKARKYDEHKIWNSDRNHERDDFQWLFCRNRTPHNQERLMLTQIIAGDSLQILGRRIHEVRALWKIPQNCDCLMGRVNRSMNRISPVTNSIPVPETKPEPHDIMFDSEDDSSDCGSSLDDKHANLRHLLLGAPTPNEPDAIEMEKSHKQLFDELMASTLQPAHKIPDTEDVVSSQPRSRNRYQLPPRVMTMALSREQFPKVKHMWFCDGKLLRLLEPMDNTNNLQIFQQQWKRGQPVLVSNVDKCLNMNLWRPESFSKEFGEDANDLVNCLTGTRVPNQPMKRFWDGFDYVNKRIKDENGEPMLLKLKDWPPGEDFADTLPTRFLDLMKSLPLSDYTKRNGKFNLANRLPDCFVKPDLGPKMYNAYGSAAHPTKGTTNLHLDISDAVNVMVYVGIPKDADDNDDLIREAHKAIDGAGCDILQRRRVLDEKELPGALWHIFAPRDANKIRDLLNKVAIERGERLEQNSDAIHDQRYYLDKTLRERLYKEYGVESYPIIQCRGDAVFIPAGAPHQVRNLLNCVKVAEDFVSPENVPECFHLTQEFRALSDTHSNHEDKLQVKNIIYHAVKDSLSVLLAHENATASANQVIASPHVDDENPAKRIKTEDVESMEPSTATEPFQTQDEEMPTESPEQIDRPTEQPSTDFEAATAL